MTCRNLLLALLTTLLMNGCDTATMASPTVSLDPPAPSEPVATPTPEPEPAPEPPPEPEPTPVPEDEPEPEPEPAPVPTPPPPIPPAPAPSAQCSSLMAITETSLFESATEAVPRACFQVVGVNALGRIIVKPADQRNSWIVEEVEFDGCDLVERCVQWSSLSPVVLSVPEGSRLCADGASYRAEIRAIKPNEFDEFPVVSEDIPCP